MRYVPEAFRKHVRRFSGTCRPHRKEVRTMFEIKGKINTAICYANVIEEEAIEQIRRMCDYEFTEGSRIRIMPDVHAGKGCTIGTTMTVADRKSVV